MTGGACVCSADLEAPRIRQRARLSQHHCHLLSFFALLYPSFFLLRFSSHPLPISLLSLSPLCSYRPMKEKNVGNKKWHSGFPLLPWQQLSVCCGWGSRQSATHKGKNTQHVLFHLRSSLSPFLYLSLSSPRCLKFQ